jgi:tRNA(fMet)-specific endonuclease VapC
LEPGKTSDLLRRHCGTSTRPAAPEWSRQRYDQAVDDFISALSILGVHLETAHAFGEIKAHLRKEGMLMEDLDLLIAATARTHNLTLVTNNQDHFGRIPGLRLDNWLEP